MIFAHCVIQFDYSNLIISFFHLQYHHFCLHNCVWLLFLFCLNNHCFNYAQMDQDQLVWPAEPSCTGGYNSWRSKKKRMPSSWPHPVKSPVQLRVFTSTYESSQLWSRLTSYSSRVQCLWWLDRSMPWTLDCQYTDHIFSCMRYRHAVSVLLSTPASAVKFRVLSKLEDVPCSLYQTQNTT